MGLFSFVSSFCLIGGLAGHCAVAAAEIPDIFEPAGIYHICHCDSLFSKKHPCAVYSQSVPVFYRRHPKLFVKQPSKRVHAHVAYVGKPLDRKVLKIGLLQVKLARGNAVFCRVFHAVHFAFRQKNEIFRFGSQGCPFYLPETGASTSDIEKAAVFSAVFPLHDRSPGRSLPRNNGNVAKIPFI